MSKTIKRLLIIISIIILSGIIQFILPNYANANIDLADSYIVDTNPARVPGRDPSSSQGTAKRSISELKQANVINALGAEVLRNSNIFCYQRRTGL